MPIIANLPVAPDIWLTGDLHQIEITLSEEGEPLDLTGLNAEFTAKLNKKDADNALTNIKKSLGDGIEFTDPENGVFLITISPEDTDSLENDTTFYWDVQLNNGTDDVFTPVIGTITFTTDITQRT